MPGAGGERDGGEGVARGAETGRRPWRGAARSARAAQAGTQERWRTMLARRLRLKLGAPVGVEITDNTYTMISFARRNGAYQVRLHHMFLLASDDVLQALAAYVRGDDRSASATLDRFIHTHRRLIRQMSPTQRQRRLPLLTRGRVHDLQRLLDEVRADFPFGDASDVAIAWAPVPRVRLPRRSIKLGSYSADTQIIRIHPALDQAFVPDYFVRWIIFHELLHHLFRDDLKARTGQVHTPEFCRLERQFQNYFEALGWERRNLEVLLWWDPGRELPAVQAG